MLMAENAAPTVASSSCLDAVPSTSQTGPENPGEPPASRSLDSVTSDVQSASAQTPQRRPLLGNIRIHITRDPYLPIKYIKFLVYF